MSVRNGFVLLLTLATLAFLAACGSSNNGTTNPIPPPSGNFSNSNLNGTYVFTVSGTDSNGAAYAMVGTITADGTGGNGKGNITAGTFDINDIDTSSFTSGPIPDATVTGTYSVSVDGRGQSVLNSNISGFPTITLDFVLSTSSHGLVTEFDSFGTGSGTLDLQAAGVTPSGSYAFGVSGATYSGSPFATAGNFTLGSGGAITTGAADFNDGGIAAYANEPLTGTVAVASTPSTTLSTSTYPSLTFDVFPIDANHLKFIEMDQTATLSGDAFSQTSPSIPTGTLAFTLQGGLTTSLTPFAAGGFMVTDGDGNITSASTEDFNQGGTLSPSTPVTFTATYAGTAGRYTLSSFASFTGGTSYAAYPSSGGVILLEIDPAGITTGVAYPTTAGATLAASQGYGLNLTGVNLGTSTGSAGEIDDIAEFSVNSNGNTITGLIDENSTVSGPATYSAAFTNGLYTAPVNGRGSISANVGTSSNNTTLNGGFTLTYYTVDGTTFPFIESDSGQVAAGIFVLQNPSAAASAGAVHSTMYVAQPLIHSHVARQKKTNQ